MATRYEYFDTAGDSSYIIRGAQWAAQTFTPQANYTITHITLALTRAGSPGNLTIGIKATDGSAKPTGADLTTETVSQASITANIAVFGYIGFTIALTTPLAVTSGTLYAIVLSAPGGSSGNQYTWAFVIAGGYANGAGQYSTNSGSTWTGALTRDYLFETWNGTPTLPTATTQAATSVTTISAVGNGNVTALGECLKVQKYGVWYGLTATPRPGDYPDDLWVDKGSSTSTGAFTATIPTGMPDLTTGKIYYCCAFAMSMAGISYGADVTFSTGLRYPLSALSRIGAIRHIYQPGLFRMQVQIGGLSTMPERVDISARKQTIADIVPEATAPTATTTPPATVTTPSVVQHPVQPPGVEPPAFRPNLAIPVYIPPAKGAKGDILTPYARKVLEDKKEAASTLVEIQRLTTSANAPGITSYAREVLIRRINELKARLKVLYGQG
jgi:hypothetical protein